MRTRDAKSAEKRSKPGRIQAVLAALGRDIAREVIPAGAVLPPEHELASLFGIGRGVVREAIKTLSAKGLVSVGPRHGTRVRPRRDWSLLDRDVLNWLVGDDKPDRKLLLAIQEVRLIIEPAAAALAADRATQKERQRIRGDVVVRFGRRPRRLGDRGAHGRPSALGLLRRTHHDSAVNGCQIDSSRAFHSWSCR